MIYLAVLAVIIGIGIGIIPVQKYENLKDGRLVKTVTIGKISIHFRLSSILWFTIFLILLLFGGLRYGVGTDFFSYTELFEQVSYQPAAYLFHTSRFSYMEWGYIFFKCCCIFIKQKSTSHYACNIGDYCYSVPLSYSEKFSFLPIQSLSLFYLLYLGFQWH